MLLRSLIILLLCLPMTAWSVQHYTVRVTDQKPQPRENFVQGLEILDDYLYVSSGNYGQSHLLRYRFADGTLDHSRRMNARVFAEGLSVLGDKVYQLTWRNQSMLVYRKSDFEFLHRLPIIGEGWGLTNNGIELIYSDGSDNLHFISPDTAQVLRSIKITENGKPVRLLNELEWIEGAIWANIWQSDRIVIIDPAKGTVTATIDLRGLLPREDRRPGTDVLNGIARNPKDGSVWVTGKRWPWLYQIELVPVTEVPETQQSQANSR